MSKQAWHIAVRNAAICWLQMWVMRLSLYGPLATIGVYRYRYDANTELCSRNVRFCGLDFQVYYRKPDANPQRRAERRRNHEAALRVNARLRSQLQ